MWKMGKETTATGHQNPGPEVAMMENAEDVTPLEMARPRSQVVRSALESFDEVDLRTLFSQRASLMKNIPRFLCGTVQECHEGGIGRSWWDLQGTKCCWRGWKWFFLLPRMLLHRPPRKVDCKVKVGGEIREVQQRRMGPVDLRQRRV